jgi:hypothetical protein
MVEKLFKGIRALSAKALGVRVTAASFLIKRYLCPWEIVIHNSLTALDGFHLAYQYEYVPNDKSIDCVLSVAKLVAALLGTQPSLCILRSILENVG